MADKVIVTNFTALKEKYGANGLAKIQAAIGKLAKADDKRGLETIVVALDDEEQMTSLGATAVTDAGSPRQNKDAIDAVFDALTPDYLMILGAIDVVPHQDLKNPLFSDDPEGDDEEFAYGDLPYACDAAYSRNIKSFTGPTRVVGRLPDLTGASRPKYLLGLLQTATKWHSRPRTDYENYLGITADAWTESTRESLTNIFNNDTDLQTSPTQGFRWANKLVNRRVHFINCHGGDTLSEFFGQSADDEDDMPVSHRAAFLGKARKVSEGTVVAAECCFGGQLYDPSAASARQMGICNTYLDKKAYGFFGSSTTAYGPAEGNDQADLICQFFIQRVLRGASLGRAALEARQRFIEKASPLSPMNRKTLAQFSLFGDPSIVPIEKPKSKGVAARKTRAIGGTSRSAAAPREAAAVERSERRETLAAKGAVLSDLQPAYSQTKSPPPQNVQATLEQYMSQMNCKPTTTLSFNVDSPPAAARLMKKRGMRSRSAAQPARGTTGFHVMFGVPASRSRSETTRSRSVSKGKSRSGANGPPERVKRIVVLEAKEVDGNIVSVSEAHSK